MDKLKIGFVFDDSLDRTDGVQQYILALGKYYTDIGHQVFYLVGETNRTDINNLYSLSKNLKVNFNKNSLSTPVYVSNKKLDAVLNELNLDIAHIQMPFSPLLAGRIIKRIHHNTVIIGTFHIVGFNSIEKHTSKFLSYIIKNQLSLFDKIFSVSTVAQDFGKKEFNLSSEILGCPVNYDLYHTGKKKKDDCFTILSLGRLVTRKGTITLLKSIKILFDRGTLPDNIKVIIAGDGPLKARLVKYCKDNNIDKIVHFLGYISEDEKISLYQAADICVFPAIGGESFGIVLLEAMAASNAVILAADNSGYRSVLNDFRSQLFPIKNSNILAKKIDFFVKNPLKRKEVVKLTSEYAKRFDVTEIGDQLLENYYKILLKR